MQHAFGQSVENTVSALIFSRCKKTNMSSLAVEELDLKMPRLKIKYLDMEKIYQPLKFEITPETKYKIVLTGTQPEFHNFKKSLVYKTLIDSGYILSFKLATILNPWTTADLINDSKKFSCILYDKIKDDVDLKKLFEQFI